jgi:hypothetical protein
MKILKQIAKTIIDFYFEVDKHALRREGKEVW